MHGHVLAEWGMRIVVCCSVLHNVLPPWDFLDDFPTAQKYYKAFVYFVGYIGLNARSTVYRSISTSNPSGPNGNGNGSSTAIKPSEGTQK